MSSAPLTMIQLSAEKHIRRKDSGISEIQTNALLLKAYSLISYRGRSQKFQNLIFFAPICSFPPRRTFPQRNLAEIISL